MISHVLTVTGKILERNRNIMANNLLYRRDTEKANLNKIGRKGCRRAIEMRGQLEVTLPNLIASMAG